MYIYIARERYTYICIYIYRERERGRDTLILLTLLIGPLDLAFTHARGLGVRSGHTPKSPANIVDFGGFDSSTILI